jgi:hypothetical protein
MGRTWRPLGSIEEFDTMKAMIRTLMGLGLVALLTAPALALQGRGGGRGMGGGLGMLLTNASVQQELKLDPTQVEKAKDVADKVREKFMASREALQNLEGEERFAKMREISKEIDEDVHKSVSEFMSKDQVERLYQIQHQVQGPQAFTDEHVQEHLKLTDAQKSDIKEIVDKLNSEMREIGQGFQSDREAAMAKITALRKDTLSKAETKLNGEQQKAWKELLGRPFELRYEYVRNVEPPVRTVEPGSTVRYTDVSCPERVSLNTTRFPIVLGLTRMSQPGSVVGEALNLKEGETVLARLEASAFFELLEPKESSKTIKIVPNEDSQPVVFYLKPKKVGTTRLTIDLFRGTEPLRTLSIPIEVTAGESVSKPVAIVGQPINVNKQVDSPAIVLAISTEPGTGTLVFHLLRQGATSWRSFPEVKLKQADAKSYNAHLFQTIASLVTSVDPVTKKFTNKTLGLSSDEVDDKLRRIGYRLWDDLVPSELKELYAKERNAWRGQTLLIFSDEPHIPWELMWPYDKLDKWVDAGPLCETMLTSRWLRMDGDRVGNDGPPGELSFKAIAVIAPQYTLLPNLAGAQKERDFLAALITQFHLKDVSPAPPTWKAVMALLEGGSYDWLHAAAHGSFFDESPDPDSGGALWLEEDRPLTPAELVGPKIESYFLRARPVFFLNACQTARQGWALTRIGGWANRLISSGAGVFIGPFWEVKDDSSLEFSREFYKTLLEGGTVAEAVHKARLHSRRPGDPTWAAYTVYAHPNARLKK